MRPKIAKLAAAPVKTSKSRFTNTLLHDQLWSQEAKGLRDTYNDISHLWEELPDGAEELLYKQTEPKLKHLVASLSGVAVYNTPARYRMAVARQQWAASIMQHRAGNHGRAVLHQARSLNKINTVFGILARTAAMRPRQRIAKFTEKTAYGHDISGEVFEGSGEIANRENQTNLNDTAQPQDGHMTPLNPLNLMRDVEADKEFPELVEKKTNKVNWPPRD